MNEKSCGKCKKIKSLDCFNKNKRTSTGYHSTCKECRKIYVMENKSIIYSKNRRYYEENKDVLLQQMKQYREDNSDKIVKQRKEYRNREDVKKHISIKNREYLPIRKENIKLKRKTNLNFRLTEIIRTKYHKMIKGRNTSYEEIIGCCPDTLKKWIEFQFDNKMNWDNMGSYWQIDHILPINKFTFDKDIEINICYNWTNLQPLNSVENRQKYNNIHLNYYMNTIINIHRFIQKTQSNFEGYQALNESLKWLREKLR